MRRVLRATRRILLGLLALAVVAAITLVIALHTAWGREQVRKRVEAALDEKVRGDVRIGGVEGTPLGDLVLVDVVIDDEAGHEVARIDRASLNVGLWSLLSDEIDLEYLRIDGAVLRGTQGPDGTIDLAKLIIIDDEPLAWDVTIDELTLTRVAFELDRRGVVDHLDDLELHGAVQVRRGGAQVTATTRLEGWWRERDLPVTATGAVRLDDAVVTVTGVRAGVGGIALASPAMALEAGRVTGSLSAVVPADVVARLIPDSPLRGDLALAIAVTPGRAPHTVVLSIQGTAGGAPLIGMGTGALDTQQFHAHLRAIGLDLERVVAVTPPEGTRGPHDLVLDVDVDLARSRGEVFAVVTDPRGGAVTVVASVDFAELDNLAVRGHVRAHHLAVADARASDLTVDLDVTGLPSRPRGTVHLVGQGVARGDVVIGPVTIDAATRDDGRIDVVADVGSKRSTYRFAGDATVTLGDTIEVALGRFTGVIDGTRLTGAGGVVAIAPTRASVKGLRLAVAGGQVAVDGWYGRDSGDLGADVVARGVDLGAVGLRGKASLTAHVARHDLAWSGTARAQGRGVVLRPGGSPVDGQIDAAAHGRVVEVAATVRGDKLGRLAVAFEIAPPRDVLDPRAWQRLPRRAVHRGHVTLDSVDLAAVAALVGQAPAAQGIVDGTLTLTATRSTGELQVRGLVFDGAPGPIDAEVALARTGPGVVDATLDARVKDLGAAHVTASVSVPTRPFDLDGWRALGADDVRGVEAKIDDLLIDGALARRFGLGRWQGHASVAISVTAGLRDATITADLLGVRGGPLLRRVDLHVDGSADRHGLSAHVQAGVGGTWLVDAKGSLAVAPAVVFEQGLAALERAPLTATVTVEDASIRRLLQAIGRDQEVEGTVSVDATITGTLAAPGGEATIALVDVGEGGAHMKSLKIDARLDGDVVEVKARGRQADGGTLQVDASAPLANLGELRGTVVAQAFELAPLAALGPTATLGVAGKLDADLAIRGYDPATAKVEGTLHLRGARLPLGASIGTMRRGDVTATIQGRDVEVAATGKIGDGDVTMTATARLVGLVPDKADMTLDVKGVTLLAPRRPKVDAHVTANIVKKGDQWRVAAELTNTRVVLASDPGRVLHDVGTPDDMVFVENGKPPPAAAAARIQQRRFGFRPAHPWLVGEIKLRRTTIKSEELRGQIRGKITLEVGDDAVAVLGSVDAVQGDVVLFDRRYRIDHAQVRFDGGDDPWVDVRLIHSFPQVTLAVNLRGKLSKPDLTLSSDPAGYSQGQLLGFLFGAAPGGRPGDETRDAATMIASSLASAKVGGFVRRFIPVRIDVLRFEAATATDRASVTVGQWLARRLYVGYRRRIDAMPEQNAGQAEVEYWLSPRIVVEGVAGDRGYHDLDLTWVRRW